MSPQSVQLTWLLLEDVLQEHLKTAKANLADSGAARQQYQELCFILSKVEYLKLSKLINILKYKHLL